MPIPQLQEHTYFDTLTDRGSPSFRDRGGVPTYHMQPKIGAEPMLKVFSPPQDDCAPLHLNDQEAKVPISSAVARHPSALTVLTTRKGPVSMRRWDDGPGQLVSKRRRWAGRISRQASLVMLNKAIAPGSSTVSSDQAWAPERHGFVAVHYATLHPSEA
ncbi:hypothetical protein VDGL01_06068 [Verticillium dahliae]